MRYKKIFIGLAIFLTIIAAGAFIISLPPVWAHVGWRLDDLKSRIKYAISPPEQAVFVPQAPQQAQIATIVQQTLLASTPTLTPTLTLTPEGPTPTPTQTPLPTLTPTAIPGFISLKGVIHEYQDWNNCGPANLAMELSYWGWKGTQKDTAPYLKPDDRDKNVMPYEMVNYVTDKTTFKAIYRIGGTTDLLKRLLAGGFPVIVEKGFEEAKFEGWMGHYEVITGYDDVKARFTAQDSYIQANLPVPYTDMVSNWRAFDFTFIVVYPAEKENDLFAILGPYADENTSYKLAAATASNETSTLTDTRDQFFAWFNRGSSLVALQDFAGAAKAYDQAYSVYPNIAEKKRPWRMPWYQTGPYFAYYYTGRYQDVINLATTTLDAMSEPILEESYYWRAMAENALGDRIHAVGDLKAALQYHPGFGPALQEMQVLGIAP
jgi:hypothetical protein